MAKKLRRTTQLRVATALLVLLAFSAGCILIPAASAQPTIKLSMNKIAGYQFGSGMSGTFAVSAKVSATVVRVEFYLNGTLVNNATAAPFGWRSNTNMYPAGHYNITAVAYDSSGQQATAMLHENFVSVPILVYIVLLAAILFGVFVVVPMVIVWYIDRKEKKAEKPPKTASQREAPDASGQR